jgi:hypothetical protein
MNDRFFRRTAEPDFTLAQHFSSCERAQQEIDTSGVGSNRTLAAFAHLVIYSAVNVWLSLWVGMADRRIHHGNIKLTRPYVSSAPSRLAVTLDT